MGYQVYPAGAGGGGGGPAVPGTTVVGDIVTWNSLTGAALGDLGIKLGIGGGTTTDTSFYIGPGGTPTLSGTDTVNIAASDASSSGNFVVLIGKGSVSGTGSNNVAIFGQIPSAGANAVAIGAGTYSDNQGVTIGSQANNSNGTGVGSVNIGYRSGINNGSDHVVNIGAQNNGRGGANGIKVGYLAGDYDTAAGTLYIDAFDRTNIAGGKVGSLIYGVMSATVASQTITFNAATTINNSIGINSTQTTLTGSAGTAVCSQPHQGATYKKVVVYLAGYTAVAQVYTFPTAFTNTPYVYGLTAGVSGATVSTTSITFTTTTLTGFVFVEGY